MTLDIRAGMFAVLRDGTVPEEALYVWDADVEHPFEVIGGSKMYARGGDLWKADGTSDYVPEVGWIAATFATRAEALAYVADNPMNRELYPDGPDLAPAPVVVDWKARAESERDILVNLYVQLENLLAVYSEPDRQLCCSGHMCGCQGSTEYEQAEHYARAALDDARALVAAAKEPRHD